MTNGSSLLNTVKEEECYEHDKENQKSLEEQANH